jgi:hypothetical protein
VRSCADTLPATSCQILSVRCRRLRCWTRRCLSLLCGTFGVALAREKKLNVLTNLEGALRPVRFELRRQKVIILRSLVFAILFLVCLPLQFESREASVRPRSVVRNIFSMRTEIGGTVHCGRVLQTGESLLALVHG